MMSENNAKKLVTILNEESANDEPGSLKDEQEKEEETATTSKPNNQKEHKIKINNEYLEVNKCEKYKSFLLNKPDMKAEAIKPSETLNKLRQFLPLFKESTDKLLDDCKTKPDEFNIENVNDDDEHIEMNVQFVPEQSGSESDDESDDEDSTTETEDNSENDEEEDEQGSSPLKRKLDDLDEPINLGFKFKTNKISKLKLSTTNGKKSKNLVELVDNQNDDDQNKQDE